MLELRNLDPGEFFAFGPAISRSVTRIKVNKVVTTHPEAGEYQMTRPVPPPRKKVKSVLQKLDDLPHEADEELRTVSELKSKVRTLEGELRKKPRPEMNTVAVEEAERRGVLRAKKEVAKEIALLIATVDKRGKVLKQIASIATTGATALATTTGTPTIKLQRPGDEFTGLQPQRTTERPPTVRRSIHQARPVDEGDGPLRAGAMRMLKAVAMLHPHPITKNQIATLSAFSVKGGTFQTYLSELKRCGWIEQSHNGFISITDEGLVNAGDVPTLPTDPEEIVEMWARKFRAGAARMLRTIAEAYPEAMSKEDLADLTGFTASGGTFQTYLSELRRNGLIEVSGNEIRASKEMFLDH